MAERPETVVDGPEKKVEEKESLLFRRLEPPAVLDYLVPIHDPIFALASFSQFSRQRFLFLLETGKGQLLIALLYAIDRLLPLMYINLFSSKRVHNTKHNNYVHASAI